MIPADYYYIRVGVSEIVRISSDWSEESHGYQNEYINEKVACKDAGKFYLIHAHLEKKTMGGENFNIVSREEITKKEYLEYRDKHGGIIDTEEYRNAFEKKNEILQQIENLYPACPKCHSVMTERSGKYGIFWGCSAYPKCNGTRNLGNESKQMEELRKTLEDINAQLYNQRP